VETGPIGTHPPAKGVEPAVGFIAAGVISVEPGVDQIFHGQRRDRGDRGLDLVVERRELPVHHDDAIAADGHRDVAALSFQPVVLWPRSMV